MKTDDHLLMLKTNMDAGHGGASGRFDRLHETAFAMAFALKVVGLTGWACTLDRDLRFRSPMRPRR